MSGSEIARQSVRSSGILLAGNLISNALLSINVLLVARLLGTDGYGTYSIALLSPTIFLIFSGVGINTALTRFAAYHRSRGETEEANRKTANGIRFMLLLAAILTLVCYLSAPLFSTFVFQRPSILPLIQLASLTVMGQVMFQSGISSLVGWSSMKTAGSTYIIQAIVKISLAPSLILIGFGVGGAVFAQVSSLIIAASFALLILQSAFLGKNKVQNSFKIFIADIKGGIRFGAPSEFGNYVSSFAGQNYVVIVLAAIITHTNSIVGYFEAATNVTVLISIVSTSLNLSLFNSFSTLYGQKGDVSKGFVYAVKYVAYFVTPFIFFLATGSEPIIRIIYGRSYDPAAPLLALIALSNFPNVIGQSIFSPYFNGVGRTRLTMTALLVDAAVSFALAPVLGGYLNRFGPYYSAVGVSLSLLASNLASGLTALYLAKKYLSTEIDYRSSILTLALSIICAGVAFAPYYLLQPNDSLLLNILVLAIQFVVFFGLYLILAPLLRVVKKDDLVRLRTASSGTGFVGRVLSIVLSIEEKLAKNGTTIEKVPT